MGRVSGLTTNEDFMTEENAPQQRTIAEYLLAFDDRELSAEEQAEIDELAETSYLENRDRMISIDIDRIKRDIAETAERHGFDQLDFTVEWGDYSPGKLPEVTVKACLF
jgi:hypothetical protein